MKQLILQIIIIIVFFSSVNAQTITFDRTLPSFEYGYNYGLFSIPSRDNGYIVCGTRSFNSNTRWSGLVIFKVNENGFLQWYSTIECDTLIFEPVQSVMETSTGSIVAVATRKQNGIKSIYAIKLDAAGDTLWEKTFSGNENLYGGAVMGSNDGNYLFLGASLNILHLVKTDTTGKIIWEKDFNGSGYLTFINTIKISGWGDGYALSDNRKIIRIDTAGNEQYSVPFYSTIIKKRIDGSIVAGGGPYIRIYDSEGNLTLDKYFHDFKNIRSLIFKNDGTLLFFSPNNLVNIDTLGNILSQQTVSAGNNSAITTGESGFLFTGLRRSLIRELKTDLLLNYTGIDFYSFKDIRPLTIFQNYTLKWYSNNVNNVDINYSINNGISWKSIAAGLPSDSGSGYEGYHQFGWTVPNITTTQLIIKINDSADPQIYDENDIPLTIRFKPYPQLDTIVANEIMMWMGNNGMSSNNPNTQGQGLYWPGGSNATQGAVFEDGLVWGGNINGKIHVGGSTINYGLEGGWILPDGLPSDSLDVKNRIFKLRKSWTVASDSVFAERLKYDYDNWPAEIGAPYYDLNKDGQYTFGLDKPMLLGDETMWFVSNDLDTTACRHLYGSDPMGLEIQTTVFGYDTDELKNAVFKKYVIINKGQNTIDSMILAYWTDDDLGDANDDYVGCDTTLNLGYTYNGTDHDWVYGTPPPAIGHMILQGPIIHSSANDSARYNNGWRKGYTNLPVTAFSFYIGGSNMYSDPPLARYEGTIEIYNQMKGLIWNGSPVTDPTTNITTRFTLYGDPVQGTGWYEGAGWPGDPTGGPGDRRYLISTGQFTLAPGDTQEIVVAVFLAKGTDNINSITKLRQEALTLQNFYNNELIDTLNNQPFIAPAGYKLYQNYPNPFNISTTIEYELPKTSNVEIKIYDILGRLVKTLVKEKNQLKYRYRVTFDGSKYASGVYFYRIQAGDFEQTKKMILLK